MAKPATPRWLQRLGEIGDEWADLLGDEPREPDEVSLPEFVDGLKEIVLYFEPPGYDATRPNSHRLERRLLAPIPQLLIWHLIDALNDFFEDEICLVDLAADNIMVNRWTCRPRFVGVRPTDRSHEKMQENLKSLADIIESCIIASKKRNRKAPPEVQNLLVLMRTMAVKRLYLIRFHPCLCPLWNRGSYSLSLATLAVEVMKQIGAGSGSTEGYQYVINNLHFDQDWDTVVKENTILKDFFQRGGYKKPRGDPSTDLHAAEAEVVMQFHCDALTHWGLVARDDTAPFGLRARKNEVTQMIYSLLPKVTISMAESIDNLGYLTVAGLEPLFPARVVDKLN